MLLRPARKFDIPKMQSYVLMSEPYMPVLSNPDFFFLTASLESERFVCLKTICHIEGMINLNVSVSIDIMISCCPVYAWISKGKQIKIQIDTRGPEI